MYTYIYVYIYILILLVHDVESEQVLDQHRNVMIQNSCLKSQLTQNLSVAGPQMTLDGAAVAPVACITPPVIDQVGFRVLGL